MVENWDVWYPKAAATGLSFARGRLDTTDKLLIHAVPDVITVEVRTDDGQRLAFGKDLERTLESPICLLRKDGKAVSREDIWPSEEHLNLPVLLPGGEVGVLLAWWNAPDQKEWRWQVELYNSLRGV